RVKAIEVQTRSEISQMSTSIQAFYVKYQVNYIPSRMVLKNTIANYNIATTNGVPNVPDDFYSYAYLKKVWPQIPNSAVVNWFPDDQNANANRAYYLEGDRCLVFFLGGIQAGGTCRGFSVIRSNPTALGGQMASPLFDSPAGRLARGGTFTAGYRGEA